MGHQPDTHTWAWEPKGTWIPTPALCPGRQAPASVSPICSVDPKEEPLISKGSGMAERESAGVGKQCKKQRASLGFVHTQAQAHSSTHYCPILRERHTETQRDS